MENGIDKAEFKIAITNQVNKELVKLLKHINTHRFINMSMTDDGFKIKFTEEVILTDEQRNDIFNLFKLGGRVEKKGKDKEGKKEYFKIEAMG